MKSFSIIFPLLAVLWPQQQERAGEVRTNLNNDLMLRLVNERRLSGCSCGVKYMPPAPALKWNDAIASAALRHSQDMESNRFFSHHSSNGKVLRDRFEAAGYRWMSIGENIARGQRDEYEVVNAWFKSPGHCLNLMSRDFQEMGAARAGEYWTQDFGKQRNW